MSLNSRASDQPSHRAHGQFLRAPFDPASRQLDVLLAERRGDVRHGDAEGAHPLRIEAHLDLAAGAADDLDLADAADALEPLLDLLVGDLGDLAERQVAGDDNLQDRHGAGIELLNHRRERGLGKIGNDQVDLVANLLGRDVAVLLEHEPQHDPRLPLDRRRSQLVDAADGIDRAFDVLGDLGFDLLGRRARIDDRDGDGRHVDVRQQIDAQADEREAADDGQRQHQHGGEHGTANAELGELVHDVSSLPALI